MKHSLLRLPACAGLVAVVLIPLLPAAADGAGSRLRPLQTTATSTPVANAAARPPLSLLRSVGAAKGLSSVIADRACVINDMTCNSTVMGMLTADDCDLGDGIVFDFWEFVGIVGSMVTIDLTSNQFDTFLFLLDPITEVVAFDDDSGTGTNSRIVHLLDATGTWTIGSNNFALGDLGNYTLTLNCSGVGPSNPPAAPSNLTATTLNSTEILLAWHDNSDNETSFRVEEKIGAGPFAELGFVNANSTGVIVSGLDPSTTATYRVRARNAQGENSPYSNEASATTLAADTPCVPSATTLCIDDQASDKHFEVRVSYETAQGGGSAGAGQVTSLNSLGITRGGIVSFFNPANPEMLIKVLNACIPVFGNRYWVFFSAGTNVGFTVIVRNTVSDEALVYINPDGNPAPPLQDTDGFPCD